VNGNTVAESAAIFDNDLIQTQKDSPARIQMTGSAATVDPETVLQFQMEELASGPWQLVGVHECWIARASWLRHYHSRESFQRDSV